MQQCLINGSLWNSEMRESPVIDMFRVAHRYGMANLLRHCYLSKDYGAFTARKSLVKRVVWEYEWRRWRASCIMYPRLETYNSIVNDIKMNVWWHFCKYNPEWTSELCNGSITENTAQANANFSRLIIYDMSIVQSLCPWIGSACIILLFRTGSGTPWCLASCQIPNAQSYGGQPAQPEWYYQTNAFWARRKLYREWDEIYIAFAQYFYSIYKTRAELYMPKKWDPHSEPAKSDYVITMVFFVPNMYS